jgi:hypothetical protein
MGIADVIPVKNIALASSEKRDLRAIAIHMIEYFSYK